MVKLVAFDLDGTLAQIGKGIAQEDISLLKTLEQRGVRIAICSGKPTYYLCGLMRQIQLREPVLVGENGAAIQIGTDLPPKEFYVHECSAAARNGLDLLKQKITEAIPSMWYQPNMVGLTPFPASEDEHRIIQQILDSHSSELEDITIYHHSDSFDISPKEINKKRGMKILGNMLGITSAETIAVGDGENDYPMFDYAGFSIGINVPEAQKVDVNFNTISDALIYLIERTCEGR